jgi:hypothetical protein
MVDCGQLQLLGTASFRVSLKIGDECAAAAQHVRADLGDSGSQGRHLPGCGKSNAKDAPQRAGEDIGILLKDLMRGLVPDGD